MTANSPLSTATPRVGSTTLLRSIGWGGVALLAAVGLSACGDDDPALEDPAALVVYTGDADKSVGTPSTFATTTVVVNTTYYFPDGSLEPTDPASGGADAAPASDQFGVDGTTPETTTP